jgi:hypothetical protein
MEAATESPLYETSNTAAIASNAVGASPSLPVKSNFGVPVDVSEERRVESSLQPVRQVDYNQGKTIIRHPNLHYLHKLKVRTCRRKNHLYILHRLPRLHWVPARRPRCR